MNVLKAKGKIWPNPRGRSWEIFWWVKCRTYCLFSPLYWNIWMKNGEELAMLLAFSGWRKNIFAVICGIFTGLHHFNQTKGWGQVSLQEWYNECHRHLANFLQGDFRNKRSEELQDLDIYIYMPLWADHWWQAIKSNFGVSRKRMLSFLGCAFYSVWFEVWLSLGLPSLQSYRAEILILILNGAICGKKANSQPLWL